MDHDLAILRCSRLGTSEQEEGNWAEEKASFEAAGSRNLMPSSAAISWRVLTMVSMRDEYH